jgi:hypothetical protein
MGKSQRTKGHGYEREVSKTFRQLYPESKRKLEYQISSDLGIDVEAGPFDIQCKRMKKYAPLSCFMELPIRQDKIRLLVTKGDRLDDMVCLRLEDFIKILKDIGEAYENPPS